MYFMIRSSVTNYIDKVIICRGMIIDRIEKIAEEIILDYPNESVYLLVIMKGAIKFASYLSTKLSEILKCYRSDSIKFEFFFEYISVSSYLNVTSTGLIDIKIDEKIFNRLRNKHVVIIEDLLDTGKTIGALVGLIKKDYTPASIKTAFLFQKMNLEQSKNDLVVNYLGFIIPNEFIVGFGTDYNQHFRDLEHLCILNQNGIDTFKL